MLALECVLDEVLEAEGIITATQNVRIIGIEWMRYSCYLVRRKA